MKQREFMAAIPILLASSGPSSAQASRTIGFLSPFLDSRGRDAWRSGLIDRGWVEGRNLFIEYRHYETSDRLPALAAELAALAPEMVIAAGPQSAVAMKSATATIPIVFVAIADPVAIGLVQSLPHPGGNVTGLTSLVPGEFLAKQIEILREMLPAASKIALLINPGNPLHRLALEDEMPRAARTFGVSLATVDATGAAELDTAFASAVDQRADAVVVFGDDLTNREAPRVVALAAKHRLPAINLFLRFADGGLLVYGPDIIDLFRRAGGYVDKIVKGARPSDLPVDQPTKFDLVINMKAAKALGLNVPPSLLVRADEVIE
jgi:putative ABC transport system substrate-binding protein